MVNYKSSMFRAVLSFAIIAIAAALLSAGALYAREPMSKGSVAVSVQAGMALPVGDIKEWWSWGAGGVFRLHIYPVNRLSVNLGVGYRGFFGKEFADFTVADIGRIPILLGVGYNFDIGSKKFSPYVAFEAQYNLQGTADIGNFYGGKISIGMDKRIYSRVDFGIGTGFSFTFQSGANLMYVPVDIKMKIYF